MNKVEIVTDDKYEAQKLASLIFVKEGNETFITEIIDVFETEPATVNDLFGLENVLLTPHIAASTAESQIVVAEMVANQFVDYFINNKITNEVI